MAAVSHNKTSLSVGLLLYEALNCSPEVTSITDKIFPVIQPSEVTLPYICYSRKSVETLSNKQNTRNDTAIVEFRCYAESYGESVELGEAVRSALDYQQMSDDDNELVIRSCQMVDASDDFEGDSFFQTLIFQIKI